ncbi:hypothetical protein BH10CHL1_BH10CHL1_14930 [soil metagenome]
MKASVTTLVYQQPMLIRSLYVSNAADSSGFDRQRIETYTWVKKPLIHAHNTENAMTK